MPMSEKKPLLTDRLLDALVRATVVPVSLFGVVTCLLLVAKFSPPLLTRFRQAERKARIVPRPKFVPAPSNPIIAPAGEYHKPLRAVLDTPGVRNPELAGRVTEDFTDDMKVIGIVVEDQTFAFPRSALLHSTRHIVNFAVGKTPISVSYCDLSDTVRVLTRDGNSKPIDLRVGGLDADKRLVFLLDGTRYGQACQDLPLLDYPFEYTTLGEWKARHPSTKVYVGRSIGES